MRRGRRENTLRDRFSVPQAVRISGLSYNVLDYWSRSGLLVPSISPDGKGTGYNRFYTFADLVALLVAAKLRKNGITTMALRRIIARLPKDALVHPLAKHRLVVWGTDVLLVEGNAHWSMQNKPGQGVLVELLPLVKKLRADVARAAHRRTA